MRKKILYFVSLLTIFCWNFNSVFAGCEGDDIQCSRKPFFDREFFINLGVAIITIIVLVAVFSILVVVSRKKTSKPDKKR